MVSVNIDDPLEAWQDCFDMKPKKRILVRQAEREIQRAWQQWSGDKNSNSAKIIFFGWLSRHRPYFLTFRSKGDRWQIVHSWLIQHEDNKTKELVTSRIINAPREQTFKAFSSAEHLANWWGPAGFTNTFDVCEFKTGGNWKFTMHGPDGKNYPNENVFAEVKAPERVVIKHISPPYFTLTITLTEQQGKTTVDWCQSFDDAETCAALRHICEPSNEQNLDRLAAEIAAFKQR
jgi:uncharacterized protein YndB with AHSA1/START domain